MTFLPSVNGSTSIQKGDGNGGFQNAVQGNDYTNTIFAQTANAVITNTTTETSAIGTGVGSTTLPANFFSTAGKTIRIEGAGIYSAAAIAPGNLVINVKLGSVIIATTTLGAILSGASSLGYEFECKITCRTAGTSGTVMTTGNIDYASTSTGTRLFGDLNNSGAVSTINTTVTQTLNVTVTWATASASNIVTALNCTIEVLW